MKKQILGAAGLAVALMMAVPASAAVFLPGSPNFQVVGDITNGTVSATIGNAGIKKGTFTDTFEFIINQNGVGSGSLSTSTSKLKSATDLDITSVTVNGAFATKVFTGTSLVEFYSILDVPITFGALNSIVVTGLSRGNGSYGGNLTFAPSAVPEVATWAMMLAGFGMVGFAARRRSNVKTTVRFA